MFEFFQDMKITKKLGLLIIAFALLPFAFTSFANYHYTKMSLKENAFKDLKLIAETEEGHLLQFLERLKGRAIDFSSDGFIRDSASKLSRNDPNSFQIVKDLNTHLRINKMSLDEMIYGINVFDLNGKVIASTDEREIGKDASSEEYFLKAKELSYGTAFVSDIHVEDHFGRIIPHLMIGAPLTEKETGELIGVITNYIDGEELNKVFHATTVVEAETLGKDAERKTLEIYLVNRDGLMITESKFVENAILRQEVNTKPVIDCKENTTTLGIYENYLGREVLGASRCIEEMGWTLIVEMDTKEAFALAISLRNRFLTILLIVSILILLTVFPTVKRITTPIVKLTDASNRVSKGDFEYKIEIESKDEIGTLANSFNKMADSLKILYQGLEKKVEERTKELNIFYKSFMNSNDMMVITDKNGTILDVNPSFERVYGYKREEVLGKNPRILKSKHSTPELYKDMWDNLLRKGYWSGEVVNVDKWGKEHPVLLSISAIRDENQKITNFIGTAVDITEKIKAEEKIRELSRFPETNPDLVLKIDEKGNVSYLNPATQEILERLRLKDLKKLFPENFKKKIAKVIETGETITEDEKQINGIFIEYTFALFPDKKSVLLRGKDITHRKKMEKQLEKYSSHLEKIVEEKTKILKILYDLEYLLRDVSLEEGLKIIESSAKKLGFDELILVLFDEEEKTLKKISEKDVAIKESLVFQVMENRKPFVNVEEEGLEVWCPLIHLEKVLGVCGFLKPLAKQIDENLDPLILFSSQVASFIEKRKILIEPTVEKKLKGKTKYSLKEGLSYLVEEETPEKSFDIFVDYVIHGVSGLCLTRTNPRFLREEYSLEKTPFIWLSSLETTEYKSSLDLTEISISIKNFVRKSKVSIIMLDGLEFLVTKFSFETVLSFLQMLNEYISTTKSILIVPVSPETLDVKQLKLLEREMTILKF